MIVKAKRFTLQDTVIHFTLIREIPNFFFHFSNSLNHYSLNYFRREPAVAIPSNRVNVSYKEGGTVWSMPMGNKVAIPSNRVNVSYTYFFLRIIGNLAPLFREPHYFYAFFFLFNIPAPISAQKTTNNSFREPLWFLGHLGTQRRFLQISPIQLSKELNSLKLNSIIFNLRQEKFYPKILVCPTRNPVSVVK